MITVQAQQILKGAAALAGLPWVSQGGGGIQTDTLASLLPILDLGLTHIWRMTEWPEVSPPPVLRRSVSTMWTPKTAYGAGAIIGDLTSNRVYLALQTIASTVAQPSKASPGYWQQLARTYNAAEYDATRAYGAGDMVLDQATVGYYAASAATTAGTAPTVGGNAQAPWVAVPRWDSTFAFSNAWDSGTLGDVYRADDSDPEVQWPKSALPDGAWDIEPNANGYRLSEDVAYAWLSYRLPVPQLSGSIYDSTVRYPVGASVYYQNVAGTYGDFYTATGIASPGQSPEVTPGIWSVVQIPLRFKSYLEFWTLAGWHVSQGQADKANIVRNSLLDPELVQMKRQLGSTKSAAGRMNVLTRIEGRR
jgi:hypothetical protein